MKKRVCGDCKSWRKATARERFGIYFKIPIKDVGRCKLPASTVVGFICRDQEAFSCFARRRTFKRDMCGDCNYWHKILVSGSWGECHAPYAKCECNQVRHRVDKFNTNPCPLWKQPVASKR